MTIKVLQTLEFVEPYLYSSAMRVLEVGCGKGEVALALGQRVQVTAIDKSESAVMSALQAGLNAQLLDLFDYPEDGDKFDIVLFTRSLHHIHPLDGPKGAISKAFRLLEESGRLIIDDFAAEKADQPTIEWYFKTRTELRESGLVTMHPSVHNIDGVTDALAWWREHHFEKHRVATSAEMRAAIQQHFAIEKESDAPLMYRYLVSELLPGVDAASVEWAILGDEEQQIEAGKMRPLGWRLVAAKK